MTAHLEPPRVGNREPGIAGAEMGPEAGASRFPIPDNAPSALPARRKKGYSLDITLPFVAAAIALLAAVLTISPWPVGVFEDDAMYTILGKSLASGQGYRFLNLPGQPNATHYPPGYPAVLAVLWKLFPNFPDNIVPFKFANGFFLAFAAWGAYTFARKRLKLTPAGAFFIALCATASVPVLLVSGIIMSEPLFIALLLPVLLLCERALDSGTARDAAIAGFACGLLALERTFGAVAVPALAIALLLRRRPLAAVTTAAVAAAVLAPWQLWAAAHDHELPPALIGKYGSYTAWLVRGYIDGGWTLAKGVIAKNLAEAVGMLTFTLMPTPPPWPRMTAAVALTALVPLGLWWLWKKVPVTTLFILGYVTVLLIWPFEPHRFLIAIAPLVAFIVLGSAKFVHEAWQKGGTVRRTLAAPGLLAHATFLVGFGFYNWYGVKHGWWEAMQKEAAERSKPTAQWIEHHTAMTDVLATDHELLIYLYTGRQAVPYLPFTPQSRLTPVPEADQLKTMRQIFKAYPVALLMTGYTGGVNNAKKMAEEEPPALKYLGSVKTALIYQVVR